MKFLYNKEYQNLMKKQVKEQIMFFLKNSIEFNIVVNMTSGIEFRPPLPEEITSSFGQFTLFAIAGYTFKSAFIENDTFIFEAGFGSENIGAFVHIDLDRILKIEKDNNPIFINLIATLDKPKQKDSFEVFASKEKNKKFFKKK